MCDVLEKLINKGIAKESREIAIRMIDDGLSPDVISRYVKGLTKDEIQKIFDDNGEKMRKNVNTQELLLNIQEKIGKL